MLHQRKPEPAPSIAAKLAETLSEGTWRSRARPSQLPPEGDWNGWVVCAGRGFGKSWVASNFANEMAEKVGRIALIAPTDSDIRDTLIEGESGILRTAPSWFRPEYFPSKGQLEWPNGSVAQCFSSREPDRLRGPQFHIAVLDEFAAMQNVQNVWDMLSFGLRLGKNPQFLITTTPRPIKLLEEIMARDDVITTRGSTFENEANLAPTFLASVKRRYEGTRLGRQEMYAELLTDVPDALWQIDSIDATRVKSEPLMGFVRIVVAIDPAMSSGEDSDETGIIVAGLGHDGRGYILEDSSGRYAAHEWAQKAIGLYKKYSADRVVAEINNGGSLVEATLRAVDPNVSYKSVHASKGKVLRAEPISALYEQNRVSHVGSFTQLEDQMCSFVRDFSKATAGYSPDRVDALVYALSELMLEKKGSTFFFG